MSIITGHGVVGGVAYGPVVWVGPRPEPPPPGAPVGETDRPAELTRFEAAAEAVAGRLQRRVLFAAGETTDILAATAALPRDRGWRKAVLGHIRAGQRAENAVAAASGTFIDRLLELGGRTAERATDLRDVRDRVLAELSGAPEPGLPALTTPSILCAEDLAPVDTAGLDPSVITALVTEAGGPTSHTAIIARQLGVPCVVAAGSALRAIAPGEWAFVDGEAGTVTRGVTEVDARARVVAAAEHRRRDRRWTGPAATSDGHRVELLANIGDAAGARAAVASLAEGIGLYRTELDFLSKETEPDVPTQAATYREVLDMFPGKKVVLRTLDAGSDKPLTFADLPREPNPALGVRGVRLARRKPELLTRQLDAIAQASPDSSWVMAPMIATAAEAAWFAEQSRARGLTPGVMIETPAAALMADRILPLVDFVSLGTNDLAQYTLAADRLSPDLVELTDPWQPAVLRLIDETCQAGRRHAVPVGVCGEAAADSMLACVLVGLGADSLSMAPPALAGVGAQLAEVDLATCRAMAAAARAAGSATEARRAARALAQAG